MADPDILTQTRQIAGYQRRLLWVIAFICVWAAVLIPFSMWDPELTRVTAMLVTATGVLVSAALGATSVILTLRLLRAMGTDGWKLVAVAVLLFIPRVSTVVAVLVVRKATKRLEAQGLQVGLMGVSDDEFKRVDG